MMTNCYKIVATKCWSNAVPTLKEWEELWNGWDAVTLTMLDHKTMLFERPIDLRHPFIFYLGHIPTFLDVMLFRYRADEELSTTQPSLTEPSHFGDIFERGIDPDMDDPTICNPHSTIPEQESDWPTIESILSYQQAVRSRLRRLLLFWATEEGTWMAASRQRAGRVVWMCFEHEAMHLETFMYMLVQSPNTKFPPVPLPSWEGLTSFSILDHAPMITFKKDVVVMGHDDDENMDGKLLTIKPVEFGWDNEHPIRMVNVSSFEMQSRPVTNGEYWKFWENSEQKSALLPASWHVNDDKLPSIKTSFGLCTFNAAANWPVQVSSKLAEEYASWMGNNLRLPTEKELSHFIRVMEKHLPIRQPNIGFASWTPSSLNNKQIQTIGDVWEWTSTVWEKYEGFTASQLYPGYSADFFDGKHRVLLGGSWATHRRIAERRSFRNWYQAGYPYCFSGFRLCRSL